MIKDKTYLGDSVTVHNEVTVGGDLVYLTKEYSTGMKIIIPMDRAVLDEFIGWLRDTDKIECEYCNG